VILEGSAALIKAGPEFLTSLPPSPISGGLGGIGPSLVGTLILMTLTSLIGLPVAFLIAVLAVEFPATLLSRAVNLVVRSFSGIPTVLVGIVTYSILVVPTRTFSLIAGVAALTIVSLPYIYVNIEAALSSIPRTYREAAYGLGLTRFQAVTKVFAGIARKGIITGLLIGLAKASGETAPLLFTIGGLRHVYFTGLLGPADAIPLLIYDFATSPYENYHKVAWGAALILLMLYIALFATFRSMVKGVVVD
ncbi:MAG: ABC transporter permease subunit, partial [Desulfurococcales archaeon]|nr:ABC transporter permease subunit [Desulfurococcales archaeon]